VLLTWIWLPLVRLPLVWLLTGTCPALPWSGLPGPCVPDALAELSLARCPAGSGLRTRRLPRVGVPVAWRACRAGRPALSLLGSRGLPGSGVPWVSAIPGTRCLPAAGVAGTGAVGPLRGPGGLPRPGGPDVRPLLGSLTGCPARRLLRPGCLPGPRVPRIRAELPRHLRTAVLAGPVGIGQVRCLGKLPLTVGTVPRRPRSLTRPRLTGVRPGCELALAVARWPRPRGLLPVSLLALRRPRLPLTLSFGRPLPGDRSLLSACPAGPVLASPRLLLLRELSRAAWTRPGWYLPRPLRTGWEALRRPWTAGCLAAEVLPLVTRDLLVARMSLIPLLPLPRVTRAARRGRALLPRPRSRGTGTLARGTWPRTAYARHRVFGTLPGPVRRCGVVCRLPASAPGIPRPRRRATALRAGWRWPRGHVRGAGPVVRETLVAGVNGVGISLKVGVPLVGVPLVGVALRVGSVAGPAVRASVRPAALTTHPVPPSVRS
jgi:hypothetical protein